MVWYLEQSIVRLKLESIGRRVVVQANDCDDPQ
jgi:hypothetical protein